MNVSKELDLQGNFCRRWILLCFCETITLERNNRYCHGRILISLCTVLLETILVLRYCVRRRLCLSVPDTYPSFPKRGQCPQETEIPLANVFGMSDNVREYGCECQEVHGEIFQTAK